MSSSEKKVQISSGDLELLARLSERIHYTNSNESFLNHAFVVLNNAIPQSNFSIEKYSVNPVSFEQAINVGISSEASLIYQKYMHQHPLLKQFSTFGLSQVYTLLGVTSSAEFHKTDLYRQFYKPLGVEDQIIFILTHPEGVYVVAYSRGEPFTSREKLLVELLKPQLQIALKNWLRICELERHLRTLEQKSSGLDQARDAGSLMANLSPRQRAVAELVAQGLENRQIAERLHVSPKTIGKHLENIFTALDIHNRAVLASLWQQSESELSHVCM